jgi:pyruvate formate lyase activating enzyme
MRIAGLEKSSFVDYPGKMAAVLFTPGCNLDCFYCHNRHLLAPGEDPAWYDPRDVLDFLARRAGLLDGVVVSGGEPTLQKGLPEFLSVCKALGLAVKLDTNGTRPWILRDVISRGLVDFVAMDVKAPLSRYEEITGRPVDLDAVTESIDFLLAGPMEYEFRTTVAPQLSMTDLITLAMRIRGADRYVLQQYRPPGLGTNLFGLTDTPQPRPASFLREAAGLLGRFVHTLELRGLPVDLKPQQGQYVSEISSATTP